MKNTLSAIALIALVIAVFVNIQLLGQRNDAAPTGGSFASDISYVASSSVGTYFHGATATRTATTTLLTLNRIYEADSIGLNVTVNNATNSPGTIYILPQVSYDTGTWQNVNLHLVNSADGALLSNINIGNGSSTLLLFTPNSQGTTSVNYSFVSPVSKYMRFRVWTTGTSSVFVEGIKLLK